MDTHSKQLEILLQEQLQWHKAGSGLWLYLSSRESKYVP